MAQKSNQKTAAAAEQNEQSYCPMNVIFYVVAFFLVCNYGLYVFDKSAYISYSKDLTPLQALVSVFQKVEELSPFMEFLEDDNWMTADTESHEKLFTKEQLAKFDGSENSPGIYLAILGQVFDVSKAPQYYGPKGGYGFFAGKDASRAYVTGQFDDEGLIDDISGLSNSDYLGLDEWISFYHKDYKYVGKLIGRFFNADGSPTENYRQLQEWMLEAKEDQMSKDTEKKIFPPCNSQWSAEQGHRVWCTQKSGGVERSWVGVPRRLFFPGRTERCACVKDHGTSLFDPKSKTDNGDLDNPHLKLYEQCTDPKASSCQVTNGENE